ncbi:MAG: hypothetical protein QOI60_517 [Actinomycetota bacterium]|nr:hypothetical protein [Actinomycetota bacterium]
MEQAPFFIVGCGRSGTTMLRLVFDAHPDVAMPMESHFIDQLANRWGAFAPAGRLDHDALFHALKRHLRRMQIDEAEARRRVTALVNPGVTDVVEAIFRVYADANGKRRWADKTPGYVVTMPLLADLWPDAKFVHLIRDGRDVALSYLDQPFGPKRVPDAAQLWRRRVSIGRRNGAVLGPSRYLEVRYEEIVADPQARLAELCDFLDLRFDPAMLDFHERSEAVLPGKLDRWRGLFEPIQGGMRDWRTTMPRAMVRRFEAAAGALLSDLDYERRFPDPTPTDRIRAFIDARTYDAKAVLVRAQSARSEHGRRRV